MADEAITALTGPYPIGDIRREPSVVEFLAALQNIELDDVTAFHRDFYGANGELMLFGAFDAKVVRKELENLLGPWRSKQTYQRAPLPYTAIAPGQHLLVRRTKHSAFTRQS